MDTSPHRRLLGIEALRGVAAVSVVASHVVRHLGKAGWAPGPLTVFQAGRAGVDLFFVISGFIILHVHRRDIGRPDRLDHYLLRRFQRVFPLYWLALALTVVMGLSGAHGLPSIGTLAWSSALLPTMKEPVLGIAWTLQFEIVFYGAFATLVASRSGGIALFAAGLAFIVPTMAGLGLFGSPSPLCAAFAGEFFIGMAASTLLDRGPVGRPWTLALLGSALMAGSYALDTAGLLTGVAARLAYAVPAGLLVLGLSAAERAGGLSPPGWLRSLGSASYAIYLFQFVFIGAAWKIVSATRLVEGLPTVALFGLLLCSAVIGGLSVSRLVERPLLRAMRRDTGIWGPWLQWGFRGRAPKPALSHHRPTEPNVRPGPAKALPAYRPTV